MAIILQHNAISHHLLLALYTMTFIEQIITIDCTSFCPANYTKPADATTGQLQDYSNTHQNQTECILTSFGTYVDSIQHSKRLGPAGPLFFDSSFFDVMQSFDRERIPERVVHAPGAGAFGYFECTRDISKYTKNTVWEYVGKKTDILVRFSETAASKGGADTVRDIRGFAVKFYTDQGIWDIVGNNVKVFWHEDPILFVSLIHSQKPNPVTNIPDPNANWDFIGNETKTLYLLMIRSTGIGVPDCYQNMEGHGINIFSCINANNEISYCKFHWLPSNGTKNLTSEESVYLAGKDPNYNRRCLYNNISNGEYPTWKFYIQIMTLNESKNYERNPFDSTEEWPEERFPSIECGNMVLNSNPNNFFAQIEQAAFSPSHMPPGIASSPDILLQARVFGYPDAHLHRVGPNHNQLPVNMPKQTVTNYQRDGLDVYYNKMGAPIVYPNSFNGPVECPQGKVPPLFYASGYVDNYENRPDDFYFPKRFWNDVLTETERESMVEVIAQNLGQTYECIQEKNLANFEKVNTTFSNMVRQKIQEGKNPNK